MFLTLLVVTIPTSAALATPLITGEHVSDFGRKVTWLVYDEFADDNPRPTTGEFTYVYNIANETEFSLPVYGLVIYKPGVDPPPFRIPFDQEELSFTGSIGSGQHPTFLGPGVWGWLTDNRTPLTLAPGEQTVDLVVTSRLGPGQVWTDLFDCNPILCNPAPGPRIIGPAVPEPGTLLLACLACGKMTLLIGRNEY